LNKDAEVESVDSNSMSPDFLQEHDDEPHPLKAMRQLSLGDKELKEVPSGPSSSIDTPKFTGFKFQ